MKRVVKWIGYFVLFLLFVAIFLPKKELYYQIEHLLQKDQIVISNEKLGDRLLWLDVKDGDLYIKDIFVGSFEKMVLYPDIFINGVYLRGFHTNRSISLFPKITIEKLDLFYTPFYPIKVFINGKTSFGKVSGWVNIQTKQGEIDIFGEPKELKKFVKLTKVKEGHYRYAFGY